MQGLQNRRHAEVRKPDAGGNLDAEQNEQHSSRADEIAACLPFSRRLIELVRPQVLVPVGGIAAKTLFATSEGITRLRGKWRDFTSPRLAIGRAHV